MLSKDGSVHVTDEFYNTLISSLGALLAVVGLYFLISHALIVRGPWHVFSFSVYGLSLVFMFTSSALHHGVDGSEKTNHLLRQLDYFAIFLTIAGTFTPFCLILLRNTLGWGVLGVIWILAALGITLKALFPHIPRWIILLLYIGMGWLGLIMAKPIYHALSWQGLVPLLVGGFFFTAGGAIYGLERPNPFPGRFGFHEIWHVFVLAGVASHFALMYFFLLPYSQ